MIRIGWIDQARGFAMLAILFFHTEMYYAGRDIVPYAMFVSDALALFFFVSGYLSFAPGGGVQARHRLRSVWRRLLVPYLLFTLAMALPKAMVHGRGASVGMLRPVLSGDASWFVATLIVAQLYSVLVRCLSAAVACGVAVRMALATALSVVPFVLYRCFGDAVFPGVLGASAVAVPLFHAGCLYRWMETWRARRPRVGRVRHWCVALLAAAVWGALKVYELRSGVGLVFYYVNIQSYALFFADTLLACVLAVGACRMLSRRFALKPVTWTGRHSLVMYFVSGGVPMLVARVMPDYDGRATLLVVAWLAVWAMAAAVAWVVYRYAPWAVGEGKRRASGQADTNLIRS